MSEYTIRVEQTRFWEVTVQAESEVEAQRQVNDMSEAELGEPDSEFWEEESI